MNVAIIDDTNYKIAALSSLVKDSFPDVDLRIARSFQSGLNLLGQFATDLVLLDMSLPTFELAEGGLEGRNRMFGGREMLAEMEFEGISTKVIIVTQFDRFGEAPQVVELQHLLRDLKTQFPRYVLGGVYFSSIDPAWRGQLHSLLHNTFPQYKR